jgi:hypothetical protein
MGAKRFVIGTVVGAVVLYLVGIVIFSLAFGSFYEANTAPGLTRETEIAWAVALGMLGYAALVTLGIGSRTGAGAGVMAGAVVGFLLWFTADFVLYGNLMIGNLKIAVVDPLLELVRGGIVGGVVAAVLAKVP